MSLLALLAATDGGSNVGSEGATPITSAASVGVLVNQSGYDQGRPKVATVTNTPDGTPAVVRDMDTLETVATLPVSGGKVNLTSVDTPGTYRIDCNGARSDHFLIAKYLNQRANIGPALAFMNQARRDAFERGLFGIAWRDSHQFSFELQGLVAQYSANPAAYTRMPYSIIETASCDFPELRTQAKPDIVWLIEFGARRYLNDATPPPTGFGRTLHALTKEQLAYFLWIYPHIAQWVPQSLYDAIWAVASDQWGLVTKTAGSWHDVTTNHNLYAVQDTIGTAKGSEPPGHKIMPNVLMWEVAQRDGHSGGQAFLDAAVANAAWLIGLDITNPGLTKGQRMSEHITMTGLCYLYEKYPQHAPAGTAAFVNDWTTITLARAQNQWDFRKLAHTAAGDSFDRWTSYNPVTNSDYNEPGSIAGLAAPLHAVARVTTDPTKRAALLKLAQAQFDQVAGRNPSGRHYSFHAPTYIEGVERGWHRQLDGVGAANLNSVPGVIEGAPPNNAYPFDPTRTGYVEGWVAFNSAWNHALAYDAAEDVALEVLDPDALTPVTSAAAGSSVLIRLRAPLNFNDSSVEAGWVEVSVDGGTPTQVVVTETSADDWTFDAAWTVPAGATFTAAYGYGLFRHEVTVTIAP